MTNRIDLKFQELQKKGKKAFIAFVTAADPSLAATERLVPALAKAGVDIVEIGVPFSDPIADGPTIQASSQRALKRGVTLRAILDCVSRIRQKTQIPIVLMTYYNPVYHFGENEFARIARQKGVDGLIIPDLPVEEAGPLIRAARKNHLSTVFFVSPTTTRERIKSIVKAASGFIYYVSLTGVTGARAKLPDGIIQNIRAVKRMTAKPVCVGFGISTPQQVKMLAKVSDGVIVGSAIVNEIYKNRKSKNLIGSVSRFVTRLSRTL